MLKRICGPESRLAEGLTLRILALADRIDEDVTVLLVGAAEGQKPRAMDRIDWRPGHVHPNRKGPKELRHVPLFGTHRHSFERNWLSTEQRFLKGNLPIADPIEEGAEGYEDLIALTANCFKINGLLALAPPPWERGLFGTLP